MPRFLLDPGSIARAFVVGGGENLRDSRNAEVVC